MTRKHFQDLAYALHLARPASDNTFEAKHAWETCVTAVADVCRKHNAAFDRERFDTACHADKYTPALHGR